MPLYSPILNKLKTYIDDRHDLWTIHGFTPDMAIDCKKKYEKLTGEKLTWDDVDSAIVGYDENNEKFQTRLNYFFLGYKMRNNLPDLTYQNDEERFFIKDDCSLCSL